MSKLGLEIENQRLYKIIEEKDERCFSYRYNYNSCFNWYIWFGKRTKGLVQC